MSRPRYRFGSFTFDPSDGELSSPDGSRRLQPQVAALLERFVTHPGQLFEHDALMEHLWPDAFVNGEALTQALSRLRRALGETRAQTRYIETLHKRGYRFIAAVTLDDSAEPAPTIGFMQTTLRGEASARRFIALSIAGHAERERIGEVARLPQLELGERVRVSRLAPTFQRWRADLPRPLADPYLSREPFELWRDGRDLRLAAPFELWIDGSRARGEVRLDAADVARGVTLELGERATLLLHECADPNPAKASLGLSGASAATEALRAELRLVAASALPVLIAGGDEERRALAELLGLPPVDNAESLSASELAAQTARVALLTSLSGADIAAHPRLRSLAAYGLVITPLGERRADIAPLLMELGEICLAPPLMARLLRHPWAGGLAELRAVAALLAAIGREGPIHELPRYLDERFPGRA